METPTPYGATPREKKDKPADILVRATLGLREKLKTAAEMKGATANTLTVAILREWIENFEQQHGTLEAVTHGTIQHPH